MDNETSIDASEDRPLAGRGERLVAQIVDDFVVFIPFAIGTYGFMNTEFADVGYFTGLGVGLSYLWLSDALSGGQSYGKRLMRIAVVDSRTDEPCRLWQSFVRNFPLFVLGPIDWVFIFGSTRRRLGDFAAQTQVVSLLPGERRG